MGTHSGEILSLYTGTVLMVGREREYLLEELMLIKCTYTCLSTCYWFGL